MEHKPGMVLISKNLLKEYSKVTHEKQWLAKSRDVILNRITTSLKATKVSLEDQERIINSYRQKYTEYLLWEGAVMNDLEDDFKSMPVTSAPSEETIQMVIENSLQSVKQKRTLTIDNKIKCIDESADKLISVQNEKGKNVEMKDEMDVCMKNGVLNAQMCAQLISNEAIDKLECQAELELSVSTIAKQLLSN